MEDASRGINDDSIEDTFNRIREENGCVINSKEVFIFEELDFFLSFASGESYGSREGQEAGTGMEARCRMQEKN